MASRLNHPVIFALLALSWLGVVGLGIKTLTNYETGAGDPGAAPKNWPSQSRIQPSDDLATLVMVAHPQCPCTRASIDELAQAMARVQGKARAYVLFLKPKDAAKDWEKTALWHAAAAIPGVTVLTDPEGRETNLFNLKTSGHTLLFNKGRLLFSGGITASRGHSGDNAGESAIVSLLNGGGSVRNQTLVFGCSLLDPGKLRVATACSKN